MKLKKFEICNFGDSIYVKPNKEDENSILLTIGRLHIYDMYLCKNGTPKDEIATLIYLELRKIQGAIYELSCIDIMPVMKQIKI